MFSCITLRDSKRGITKCFQEENYDTYSKTCVIKILTALQCTNVFVELKDILWPYKAIL